MGNRGNKKTTKERFDKFKELNLLNKYTDKEMGDLIGISALTICKYRKKLRIKKIPIIKGFASNLIGKEEQFKVDFISMNNKNIAKKYNISIRLINVWRKKLNLPAKKGNQWIMSSHPKGMKGKTHTEENKIKNSVSSKIIWNDPIFRENYFTEERLQKMSDTGMKNAHKMLKTAGQMYSKCKRGVREDIGLMHFRSAWEANYARYLNYLIKQGKIYKWEFEPEIFWFLNIKRGVRSYMPDFKVWEKEDSKPYFVEVKGYMDARSATKLKRMAKYYPEIKIELVNDKVYKQIKMISCLIPNWE